MSKKKLKNHKLAITVACMTLSGGLLLGLSTILGQQSITSLVASELSEVEPKETSDLSNKATYEVKEVDDFLYKDFLFALTMDEAIEGVAINGVAMEELDVAAKQKTCEKFNLDYQTVLASEVSAEMYDYEKAVKIKLAYGELLLLSDSPNKESLESMFIKMYATASSHEVAIKEAILTVAKAAEIDPATTKVNELSEKQIELIEQQVVESVFAIDKVSLESESDEEVEVN